MPSQTQTAKKSLNTYTMVLVALLTAVICVLSPFSIPIPISPVPISLATLAICFSAALLGWKLGTLSCILYLLLGLAGVPVFANFTSGVGKLFGPTGGYMIGYILLAAIAGYCFEKFTNKALLFSGCVVATAACYLLGTLWLAQLANLTFYQALWAGVIPYIPGDLVKIVFVILITPIIKNRIRNAGLLQ